MKKKYKGGLLVGLLLITGFMAVGCGGNTSLPADGEVRSQEKEEAASRETMQKWEDKLTIIPHKTVTAQAIRGMWITKGNAKLLEVAYDPREGKDSFDYWNISVPYRSMAVVNTEELYKLFAAAELLLGQMEPVFGEEAVSTKEVEALKIFLAFLDGQPAGQTGGAEPDRGLILTVDGKNQKGNYLLRLEGASEVYTASPAVVEPLLEVNPFDYILKVPALVNKDTVKQVEIHMDGSSLQISKTKEGCFFGDRAVEEDTYNLLYMELLSVLIKGERDNVVPETTEKTPVLSLRFLRNLPDASDYNIHYFEYDETSMSVEVNGTEFFLVDKKDVEALKASIQRNFSE